MDMCCIRIGVYWYTYLGVPCGAVEKMMGLCICVKAHSKYATKAWQ